MNPPRGKFITIEGIEGVGKSTQLNYVLDFLRVHNIPVITTREPGGTPLAEDIRQLLLQKRPEKVAVDTELLLLFASRAQHLREVIFPALERGDWVVCDRFLDSTYAYQGGGRQIPLERIHQLSAWTLGDFSPDLTLLLDVPVEQAMSRAKARSVVTDRFESEKNDFFTRVRNMFLIRAAEQPHRIKIIDASQTIAQVQKNITQICDLLLT